MRSFSFFLFGTVWLSFIVGNVRGGAKTCEPSPTVLEEITNLSEEDGEGTRQQPISTGSSDSPQNEVNSTFPQNGQLLLQGHVKHVLDVYDKTVDEMVVYQTESWLFFSGMEGINEAEMGSCPRVTPKAPRSVPTTILPPDAADEFIWDDESDIKRYLNDLYNGCSKDALKDPDFDRECWELLHDLVYKPRCTTRFDSRVHCRRGKVPNAMSLLTTINSTSSELDRDIFQGYFTQRTLNMVIIGAGPAGLFLANALAESNKLPSRERRPKIRIVVIENRIEAPGIKQGYLRDWSALLFLNTMTESLDPLLARFFQTIAGEGRRFSLPLNALETLLLMSTRNLGVKFLYGDLTAFAPTISTQPNLIVFDATGHRLDGLVRGDNCPRPDPNTQGIHLTNTVVDAMEIVQPWEPSGNKDLDWGSAFPEEFEVVKEYDTILDVARKGDILYPVTKRDGIPFASWWLYIGELPSAFEEGDHYDPEFWDHLSDSTEYCRSCDATDDNDLSKALNETRICEKFCMPNMFFDDSDTWRADIAAKIINDNGPIYGWYSPRCATIRLSADEAKRLLELIEGLGYHDKPNGMPLKLLPLQAMAQDDTFKNSLLLLGLESLANVDEGESLLPLSVYQQRPYIYRNGKIRGDIFGVSTTILRIGDSLTSGDVNQATGIVSHFWMLQALVCRIRGEEDGCTKVPSPILEIESMSGSAGSSVVANTTAATATSTLRKK